jgi:hypothetical protein
MTDENLLSLQLVSLYKLTFSWENLFAGKTREKKPKKPFFDR